MNDIESRQTEVASGGFSLTSSRFRTWVLLLALLFAAAIFGLASQQTTAFARSDSPKTASIVTQDDSGVAPNDIFSPTVAFSKTGPSMVAPGSIVTYKLKITNSDPISYGLGVADYYPPELTYLSYTTNGQVYCLSDILSQKDKGLSFAQDVKPNGPSTGAFVCEAIVGANQSFEMNITFQVNGAIGTCFTNVGNLLVLPYYTLNSLDAAPNVSNPIFTSDATTCVGTTESSPPADLIPQLRVNPDRTAFNDPATDISYTLTVKNIGVGEAEQVQINFPYDPTLDVGYFTSPDPSVWVSAVVTNVAQPYVTINLPNIANNGDYSGTLVLHPTGAASDGASIFNRYTVKWDDADHPGKSAGSNGVRYTLSNQAGSTLDLKGGEVQLFDPAEATVSNGQEQVINGDFFAPNEMVTVWYTDEDNNSTPLGSALADATGHISISITPVNLTAGDKYVVAGHGNRSDIYGSSVLTIGS